jgi:hypothetical protein
MSGPGLLFDWGRVTLRYTPRSDITTQGTTRLPHKYYPLHLGFGGDEMSVQATVCGSLRLPATSARARRYAKACEVRRLATSQVLQMGRFHGVGSSRYRGCPNRYIMFWMQSSFLLREPTAGSANVLRPDLSSRPADVIGHA